jgi:PIN domain nuclease of toxin-antitoxin system
MSQIIVLDTHIWIWFVTQEFEMFPSHWRELIETVNQVGISPVSCYEVALAQQKGRLELPCSVDRWFQEALEPTGITLKLLRNKSDRIPDRYPNLQVLSAKPANQPN